MARCGGVSARVIQRRIMRTPHFVTDSIHQAQTLSSWLISHLEELKLRASEVSQHCKLQALEPWFVGPFLLPYFFCLILDCIVRLEKLRKAITSMNVQVKESNNA